MQLPELDVLLFRSLDKMSDASAGPLTVVGLRQPRREHARSRHPHVGRGLSYKPNLSSMLFLPAEPCFVESAARVVHQSTCAAGLENAGMCMAG